MYTWVREGVGHSSSVCYLEPHGSNCMTLDPICIHFTATEHIPDSVLHCFAGATVD